MLLETGNRKQRHVLIADGMSEVGTAVVQAFAERGATSAFFCGNRFREALLLSRDTGALNIKCNILSQESLASAMDVADAFFEHRLNTVICNIRPEVPESLGLLDFEEITECLQHNLDSICAFLKDSISMLIEDGSVVVLLPKKEQGKNAAGIVTGMIRGALEGMIESTAQILKERGIRMNGMAMDEENVSPESVAKTIRFLASSESTGITGRILQL